jgi:hypothetical protein
MCGSAAWCSTTRCALAESTCTSSPSKQKAIRSSCARRTIGRCILMQQTRRRSPSSLRLIIRSRGMSFANIPTTSKRCPECTCDAGVHQLLGGARQTKLYAIGWKRGWGAPLKGGGGRVWVGAPLTNPSHPTFLLFWAQVASTLEHEGPPPAGVSRPPTAD